jgi:lipid-A-disaccharide synthase
VREVLILAGEASGDLHGAALAEQLHRLRPDLALAGTGGARMRAAGVTMLEEHEGVVGFVEVIRHIPSHYRLLKRLTARLQSGTVSLVILIDYPGFNMRVAAAARAAGVPVLYYITPQVWAWKAGRMKTMARDITKAAVILPFEEQLLRDNGIDATFVGHPLLDRAVGIADKREARRRIGLPEDGEVLALFPGSRAQEILRHLDDFLAVARELERRRPGLHVVVPLLQSATSPERPAPSSIARARSATRSQNGSSRFRTSGCSTSWRDVASPGSSCRMNSCRSRWPTRSRRCSTRTPSNVSR